MNNDSISQYFEADHDRLDDLFKNYQQWKNRDIPRAREYFAAFKFGLQRHIVWEEDVLFPLYERKTGISHGGPTYVMRLEHEEIIHHLQQIDAKLQKNEESSDRDESNLLQVLHMHNVKEEEILYPAIEREVSDSEVEGAFREMKTIPDEKFVLRDKERADSKITA